MLKKREQKSQKINDEEESLQSDNEYLESRIGNIPLQWYQKDDHLGYNIKGKKFEKSKNKSQIDKLIEQEQNPDYWRIIEDKINNTTHYLTNDQIKLLKKIKNRTYINDEIKNKIYDLEIPQDPFPMTNIQLKKSSYMPSKHEQFQISKLVHALKMGWIKPKTEEKERNLIEEFFENVYDTWDQQQIYSKNLQSLTAPKLPLPTHSDSFNPPAEFQKEIENKINFRGLESSTELIRDQFERLMSLYLAPRVLKKKISMRPEDLIQKLPDIEEMKPFPTKIGYKCDSGLSLITCVTFTQNDLFFAIVDQFCNIQIHHTFTTRQIIKFKIEDEEVISMNFTKHDVLMVVTERSIIFYNINFSKTKFDENIQYFNMISSRQQHLSSESHLQYRFSRSKIKNRYFYEAMSIRLQKNNIYSANLHQKEEYLVLVSRRDDDSRQIDIINIQKCKNTKIKIKAKSKIQKCKFHNKKPLLFIMTINHIFVFDLQKQKMVKKLISGCKRLSDLQIHKSGNHILAGTYDKKLLWFDLEGKEYPFKKMDVHSKAIRKVSFSNKFNLFASCSDDKKIVIQYNKIDSEGFSYPSLIPLKILTSHTINKQGLSVFECVFLNNKYWLMSAGSFGIVNIWV